MDALEQLLQRREPGRALEQPFYLDKTIFREDMRRIFRTGWLFAGHVCQIAKPGDYFTYELDGESIIIIRGRQAQIHALFNTCRHRGSRICTNASGHLSRLVCPYHQWTYDIDGTLLHNTWMPDDFDKSKFGLHAAHVRDIAGLIFISLARDPPSFDGAEADLTRLLGPHGLDRAKLAYSTTYDIKANWKLVIENQRECYHCRVKHKGYAKIQQDTDIYDPDKQEEVQARVDECRDRWATLGLDVSMVNPTSRFTDAWWRANRAPFRKGYVSETVDGQPVAPLMGDFTDPDVGNARANVYPNFWLHASSDHAHTMRVTPIDETTTRIQADWLVHQDAVEGIDYDTGRVTAFSAQVNEEDRAIVLEQARGVQSSRYQPGPYSPIQEENVEHFVRWYIEQMSA